MKFVYHIRGRLYKYAKKSLNISKVLSETVNRRTDNTMHKIVLLCVDGYKLICVFIDFFV